jgi:hypothetical protein
MLFSGYYAGVNQGITGLMPVNMGCWAGELAGDMSGMILDNFFIHIWLDRLSPEIVDNLDQFSVLGLDVGTPLAGIP